MALVYELFFLEDNLINIKLETYVKRLVENSLSGNRGN